MRQLEQELGVELLTGRPMTSSSPKPARPRASAPRRTGRWYTVFPGEFFPAPRSWTEQTYPNVVHFNQVDRGGHFAAWEEPELFAAEMRAAYSSMR